MFARTGANPGETPEGPESACVAAKKGPRVFLVFSDVGVRRLYADYVLVSWANDPT